MGHSINTELKPDWQKLQGPPSEHFAEAKADRYDFYVTTDHSQEAGFNPPSPSSPDWVAAHKEAAAATDKDFVAKIMEITTSLCIFALEWGMCYFLYKKRIFLKV